MAAASSWPPYANLTSFGGVPNDSTFDNTPAFNAALAQRVTGLYIPRGTWYFRTKPNDITYPIELLGEGFSSTYLMRSYSPQSDIEALLTIRSLDCHMSRLGIGAGRNTAGGVGIAIIADNSTRTGFVVIEDVYVSTEVIPGGTWSYAVNIDGAARTNTPIGARDIEMRNCSFFAATNAACRINGGIGVSIRGGGLYPAGGATGRLQITGTDTVNSNYVTVDTTFVGGISLDYCQYVNVRSAVIAGDITNASSAQDVLVTGACTGSIQGFWRGSRVVDPSAT